MALTHDRARADDPAGPAGTLDPPTPQELHAFVRVAETLHFGRAADSLGIARSSLSECIRRLEDRLDAVLFERSTRRVTLTGAGADLLPRARAVTDALDEARRALGGARGGAPDIVRVGVEGCGFDRVVNHRLVERFRELHPGVELRLFEMHGTPQGFLSSGADIAFVRSPMVDPRLRVVALAHEPRGLIVSSRHPAAGDDRADLGRMLDEVFVAIAPQDPVTCDYWSGAEVRAGRPARLAGAANSTLEVLYAVSYFDQVTTGTPAAVEATGMPGLCFLPSDELSPVRLGVAVRADERRRPVLQLVETALELAEPVAAPAGAA